MARRALIGLCAMTLIAATFGPWEHEVTQQPVEQQTPGGDTQPDQSLWVINPTVCAWDADDRRSTGFTDGVIAAGETVTGSRCVIVDGRAHSVWFSVLARSRNLVVRIRFEPQGIVFTAGAVTAGTSYEYWTCSDGPEYDESAVPSLPAITGSNGGHGEETVVTISITNPTNHAVRKVHSFMRLAATPAVASGGRCDYEDLPTQLGTYPGPFIRGLTS